jgi:hypothetical protein
MTNTTALAGKHEPVPLPFARGSLNAVSEKLISSHHEKDYGGAVKNLNKAEQELANLNADTPSPATTLRSSPRAYRCSSWTCTSTATRWILALRCLGTSTPSSPT